MGRLLANTRGETGEQAPSAKLPRHRLRRSLIALSLANLAFLSAWQRRLYGTSFLSPSWSWADELTMFLNVLLLAAIFYLLLVLAAKLKLRGRTFEGLVYSIPLFAVSNVVRRIAFPYHGPITAVLLIVLPLAAGIAIVFFPRKLLPAVEFIAVGLVVLLPLNLFRMALVSARHNPPPVLAGRFGPAPPVRRVVVMIFDEMDFALSFPRRPVGIHLPEFDRVRAQALFATAAHQPATDTEKAVPSIISGREFYGFPAAQGDRSLLLRFSEDGPPQDWGAAPNLFADMRSARVNVGVVGWYLPYCRIFASLITDCYSEPIYSGVTDTPAAGRSFVDELDALTPLESRVRLIQRLRHVIVKAESMADDPQLGLVFIHLPVPHGPEIFDRYSSSVTPFAVHKDWFFDNLLLADRTLGVIRGSMERAGLWDHSAIIITSDHSLRQVMMVHPDPVPLVPFMVKMPGQRQGVVFDTPFTTPIIRPLISAILRGEITATNLPDWIRQHAR